MNQPWHGDFPVNVDTAKELIQDQFPHLGQESIRFLGSGWDNQAFLVDARWVFRFPHRQLAVELIARETRWLPELAKRLPLQTSAAVWIDEPSARFPYPFAGSAFIPGESLDRISVADERRLAHQLGTFLRELHNLPITEAAPHDELRRADIFYRIELLQKRLLADDFNHSERSAMRRAFEIARAARSSDTHSWVHGDLYPRHVIIENDQVSGIIDWGDMHVGDPAIDASIAFTLGSAVNQEAFWSAYQPPDSDFQIRAAFRALHYGIVLRSFGREASDEAISKTADRYLRSALEFFNRL